MILWKKILTKLGTLAIAILTLFGLIKMKESRDEDMGELKADNKRAKENEQAEKEANARHEKVTNLSDDKLADEL